MEDLTSTQLILLALLVSFVTSIATGIVTVTLLDQAPPGITQTINRVVERTVEKVVPGQAASVITKETTIVIKEENLIIDAVEKNSKSVVRIGLVASVSKEVQGSATDVVSEGLEYGETLGIGVVVSNDGSIITDALNLSTAEEYLIKTQSGRIHVVHLENIDSESGLAFLKVVTKENEEVSPKFIKPSFGNAGDLRLGQTVIAIGGLNENSVLTGIVSKLNKKIVSTVSDTEGGDVDEEPTTTETEVLDRVLSNLAFSSDYSGGPLLDVDGFLLGINIKRKDGDFSIPISVVLDIISKKLENTEKSEN